ncbi:MAG: translocation/assembly module TamB domain-containing protein [Bdellovibrionales bacterium]|nr:translocation/assembly module TamB domain-containing protein [Bdellovibrionales bacterium]
MYKLINFLKTKKVLFILFFLTLFFLFTPISLIQIGKKIESFINEQAKIGVVKFQKQTGLSIDWENLDFNIFNLTVYLEGVKISYSPSLGSQEIEELKFLDNVQEIKSISARPSLFSLLFDKRIFLSKVYIEKGNIFLKTAKIFRSSQVSKNDNFQLPIKKLIVEDTQITLKHKKHVLKFSQINSSLLQRENRRFDFNFSINRFFFMDSILKNQVETKTLSQLLIGYKKKNEIYKVSTKGTVKPGHVFFSNLNIKNDFFESDTKSLNIYFDSKRILKFSIVSEGTFSSILMESALAFIDKPYNFSDSYMDYNFNISYKKGTGYEGRFKFLVEDILFRNIVFKKIDMQGHLQRNLLLVDKGVFDTKEDGNFSIQKTKWFFFNKNSQFTFTAKSYQLSLKFIEKILNPLKLPFKGRLTGLMFCKGVYKSENIECKFEGSSRKIQLQSENTKELFSIYNFDLNFNFLLKEKKLDFNLKAQKKGSALLVEGSYEIDLNQLSAKYVFEGNFYDDIQFKLPFDLKGGIALRQGVIFIKDKELKGSGFLSSSLLKINNYNFKNVRSSYQFTDKKLVFSKFKGNPGKTQYLAEIEFNFNQSKLDIQLESQLFQIKDFFDSVKNHFQPQFNIEGTGTLSFSFSSSWKEPDKKNFDLQGNFFNIVINKDFFKQAHFHFIFKENQGFIPILSLKKIQGYLEGKGMFNKDYVVDVDIDVKKLPIESFNFLNDMISFNQTGDINGKLKITRDIRNPFINGNLSLSNAFLYSFPIKDSQFQVKINKDSFYLQGNVSEEFQIEELSYLFKKNSEMKLKGYFNNLDLIAYLNAKNQKNNIQDYKSMLTGRFDLEKKRFWDGFINIDKLSIFKFNKVLEAKKNFTLFLKEKSWSLTPTWFSDSEGNSFNVSTIEKDYFLLKGRSDLIFFSVFFPFLNHIEGQIQGNIVINNNLKDVKANGSLKIDSGILEIPLLPKLSEAKTNLIFSDKQFYVNSFQAFLGGGNLKGLGTIKYPFSKNPHLDLNFDFEKVHFTVPEGINTKGKGNVKVKGSKIPYLLKGHYDIESGSIVREFSSSNKKKYDFDLLKKLEKEYKDSNSFFQVDLKLNVKNPIQINSSLIHSFIEGKATLLGPLDSLLMKGNFNFSKGEKQNLIFFRGQEFKINRGTISFLNSKPQNPYIDISAQSVFKERLIDPLESEEEIEKEYTILLFTKGWADNLDFSLRSFPVLNEKEIISLLTLGVSSRRFDSDVKQDVEEYSYQILASLLLEKHLNREIKDALGVDFRLTPYINNLNKPVTKITLSKTLWEKWRASFSRTIEESANSDFRFKYDISPKLSLTTFWENTEQLSLDQIEEDWFGFDFEFNFDF